METLTEKPDFDNAKKFWSLNAKDYDTYWISSDDRISFKSDDLWKYMNDYVLHAQSTIKELESRVSELEKEIKIRKDKDDEDISYHYKGTTRTE